MPATVDDVKRQLLPMLRHGVRPTPADVEDWTTALVNETRQLLAELLPLAQNESSFLHRLNDEGRIEPELLTDDPVLRKRIRMNPGLQWKALNVREHHG